MRIVSFRSVPLFWGMPLIAILVTLLGSCDQGGMPQDQVEPPKQTLVGTWQRISHWEEDTGERRTTTTTLTFTKSLFIEIYSERDANGEVHDAWEHNGTWSVTGDTVTKTYYPWDDEADSRAAETISVDKEYLWVDAARDVLLVHIWGSDDTENSFERYTRVRDPLPSIDGVWKDKGRLWALDPVPSRTVTLTFGDSFTYQFQGESNDGATTNFIRKGSWRRDADEQMAIVTVQSETYTVDGATPDDFDPTRNVGREVRYAYAASGIGKLAAFSIRWSVEVNVDRHPYRSYGVLYERQSQ